MTTRESGNADRAESECCAKLEDPIAVGCDGVTRRAKIMQRHVSIEARIVRRTITYIEGVGVLPVPVDEQPVSRANRDDGHRRHLQFADFRQASISTIDQVGGDIGNRGAGKVEDPLSLGKQRAAPAPGIRRIVGVPPIGKIRVFVYGVIRQ